MSKKPRPAFMQLVRSGELEDVELPAAQASGQPLAVFLPSDDPSTLIFLNWNKINSDDVADIFELSKPRIIFDLRLAPHFDLGGLTRRAFFGLLSLHNCEYVDLFGRIGVSNVKNSLLNPAFVAEHISRFSGGLSVPHAGPFVFIHDDEFLNDDYIAALTKQLPRSGKDQWRVFRPLSERGANVVTAGDSLASGSVAPLVRNVLFISHATPDDNSFVNWLAAKLSAAGYEIWADILDLNGGDGFWGNIEDVIRTQAAKMIFVHSSNVKGKSGPRKEIYLGLKVGERNRIQRFVVPLRIDDTPFDETFIELIDIQSIDCRADWLAGLKSLLALLARDRVPRRTDLKSDQFSDFVARINRPTFIRYPTSESHLSNWLPIDTSSINLNFFSLKGVTSNQLPDIASQLNVPAFAYYTHLVTTADKDRLADELVRLGLDGNQIGTRAVVSWSDFVNARYGDLPSWKVRDARNRAFGMLHKAWAGYVSSHKAEIASLANGRTFSFFADQHFERNEVRFETYLGKRIRRQLVGYSAKRRVFWHFGVQARASSHGDKFYYVLTPHVTFSSDGRTPLISKAQLHSLRRSFCRSWWNDRWRDLLQAFVAGLASEERLLHLDIGSNDKLGVGAGFMQFESPISIKRPDSEAEVRLLASMEDDVVEDVWDEDELIDGFVMMGDESFDSRSSDVDD